jgi:small-conductance mechanosensitive channel
MPNKQVFENPIMNYTIRGTRRVDISLGVSYGEDLEKAKRVAMEAVAVVPSRLPDREVELFYEELAESSIDFTVRFWIPFETQKDYLAARSDAIIRIKQAFDANGITIPFPTRTLDFARTENAGGGLPARHISTVANSGPRGLSRFVFGNLSANLRGLTLDERPLLFEAHALQLGAHLVTHLAH